MMEKIAVYDRCLKRWDSSDERVKYFCENYDEWLEQLPVEAQEIVLQLLDMFEYYTQPKVNRFLFELEPKLKESEYFNADTSLYTPLASEKGINNSSDDYLFAYRHLHGISKFKIARDLKQFAETSPEKYSAVENIVIVDDYCGSGESLRKFLEKRLDLLSGKRVFYIVTYIMEESLDKIQNISETLGLEIKVIYINKGRKAFDMECFAQNAEEARALIKSLSKSLNIHKNCRLGKYKSEALVAFYNDTPNNDIGVFWYDSDIYFSIFPRELENTEGLRRPTPRELKEKKKQRNAQNYNSFVQRVAYD